VAKLNTNKSRNKQAKIYVKENKIKTQHPKPYIFIFSFPALVPASSLRFNFCYFSNM